MKKKVLIAAIAVALFGIENYAIYSYSHDVGYMEASKSYSTGAMLKEDAYNHNEQVYNDSLYEAYCNLVDAEYGTGVRTIGICAEFKVDMHGIGEGLDEKRRDTLDKLDQVHEGTYPGMSDTYLVDYYYKQIYRDWNDYSKQFIPLWKEILHL